MAEMKLKKKSHPKFNVPNYGSINRSRVKERWRKQRGIDNKKRIKKAFMGAEPNIGWGNPAELRGIRADGKRAMVVHNINELKALLQNPQVNEFDITLAASLSRRKRTEMIKLADQNKVRVTNKGSI